MTLVIQYPRAASTGERLEPENKRPVHSLCGALGDTLFESRCTLGEMSLSSEHACHEHCWHFFDPSRTPSLTCVPMTAF